MTVADLKQELERFSDDREVYVASGPVYCYRLLGVVGDGRLVLLDPSISDDDKREHQAGVFTATGARA